MKKSLLLMATALFAGSAFAQHYEWDCSMFNNNTRFATVDEAVAAGYQTIWTSGDYIGVPSMDLIKNDEVVVSLACPYNYLGKGNGNYAGKDYGYKIIMGMNNSGRDGIDATVFSPDSLTGNKYVRKIAASDQGNEVQQAILKIVTAPTPEGSDPWTSTITIKANRGNNLAAFYVVDATKQKNTVQSQMRNHKDNVQYDYFRFQVEQNHTYYVICSENASAEIYGITYDSGASAENELLATEENCTDLWTCEMFNNNTRFATVDEAVAAGYQTIWTSGDYIGVPAQTLVESENVKIELACPYNYLGKGNGQYAGANRYGYKLIMGMNNSTRDGIDPTVFSPDSLTGNKYMRKIAASDQGNEVQQTIVKITVPNAPEGQDPFCGRLMLNWSRGGNAGALYVVDATKQKMELQENARAIGDGKSVEFCSIVNLYPGRTYYVLCSENASVELYRIGFCDARSEKFGKLFTTTDGIAAIQAAPAKDNVMYNLLGQRVNNAKGIVIMNGRKMIIK